jgi:membrane associated rhomboid family serine protease
VLIPLGFAFFRYIRAVWVLGIWFGMQIVPALVAPAGGGVAWWAHVGGFVAGFALAQPLRRRITVRRRRAGPWG